MFFKKRIAERRILMFRLNKTALLTGLFLFLMLLCNAQQNINRKAIKDSLVNELFSRHLPEKNESKSLEAITRLEENNINLDEVARYKLYVLHKFQKNDVLQKAAEKYLTEYPNDGNTYNIYMSYVYRSQQKNTLADSLAAIVFLTPYKTYEKYYVDRPAADYGWHENKRKHLAYMLTVSSRLDDIDPFLSLEDIYTLKDKSNYKNLLQKAHQLIAEKKFYCGLTYFLSLSLSENGWSYNKEMFGIISLLIQNINNSQSNSLAMNFINLQRQPLLDRSKNYGYKIPPLDTALYNNLIAKFEKDKAKNTHSVAINLRLFDLLYDEHVTNINDADNKTVFFNNKESEIKGKYFDAPIKELNSFTEYYRGTKDLIIVSLKNGIREIEKDKKQLIKSSGNTDTRESVLAHFENAFKTIGYTQDGIAKAVKTRNDKVVLKMFNDYDNELNSFKTELETLINTIKANPYSYLKEIDFNSKWYRTWIY